MPALTITTESGTIYEFDADARTVTRNRQGDSGHLRRDGEALNVLNVLPPAVGKPLQMLITVRTDGFSTLRTTSVITHIEGDPTVMSTPPAEGQPAGDVPGSPDER